MCRHLAYLGPPVPLRSVLIDPPFSLYRQAWAPRRQRHGTVNADGFGIGWYADGERAPARYRRGVPIWGDSSLPDLARVIRSGAIIAAVRSATPGTALGETAVAPFARGRWLFSHNGVLNGWPASAAFLLFSAGTTAQQTPAQGESAAPPAHPGSTVSPAPTGHPWPLEAMVDSALLWALVCQRMAPGKSADVVLATTIRDVMMAGGSGRFNFLMTDGNSIFATADGDTLWYRLADRSVTVASEPDDDGPGWIEVPSGRVLTATPDGVLVRSLNDLTEGIRIH